MANTATLRKLGGSTVIAIPPAFLESLRCAAGDEVELRLKQNMVEMRPRKKKLSLSERLTMFQNALAYRTQEEAAEDKRWDSAPAVGREL